MRTTLTALSTFVVILAAVLFSNTGSGAGVSVASGGAVERFRDHLAGLDRVSKTVSATGDIVIQGLRVGSASLDRSIDTYNDSRSREEARYSPLENRSYVVDAHLEQFAANPSYPQEALVDVSVGLWNQFPRQRTPD